MSKEIIIRCPSCNTVNRGKYGFIFHRRIECVKCKIQINPKTDANKIVTCQSCGNDVVFDTTKAQEQVCPVCGAYLYQHEIMTTEVVCPTCHMTQNVNKDEETHVCPICDTKFNVQQAISANKVQAEEKATVVTVPANNNYVIWQHPQTVFPYASQVVVPEGYTGLILYNGVCKQPFTPGNYILSDSVLSQEDQLRAAVGNPYKQVSVQIFFVKKIITKEMAWNNQPVPVVNRHGQIEGTLGVGGSISLRIIDAKQFAEFVGYQSVLPEKLLPQIPVSPTKLSEDVRLKCFNSAISVFNAVVQNTGLHYSVLDSQKTIYTPQIRNEVDRYLMEIGLQSDSFAIDYIQFKEDKSITQARDTDILLQENAEKVREYVERPFAWVSPTFKIHIKDDLTKSAEIVMGGDIKFFIENEELFARRSEVRSWIKNGVDEYKVSKYCSELVSTGTQTVLVDILQPMINDTNADIRDLSIYYRYMRERIEKQLSDFFYKYGLSVDMFTMEEKRRTSSRGLDMMSAAAEHKTEEQIKMEVYEFDNKNLVKKAEIKTQTELDLDSTDVYKESELLKHKQVRTDLNIKKMYMESNLTNVKEQMERDQEHKHRDWARDDYKNEKYWQRQESQENKSWAQQDYVTDSDFAYTQQVIQKERNRTEQLKDRAWKKSDILDNQSFQHEVKVNDINNKTSESKGLHYLNLQEIELKAMELRKQWEADSSLNADNMMYQIRMRNIRRDDEMNYAREKNALEHELEQADYAHAIHIQKAVSSADQEIRKSEAYTDQEIRKSESITDQTIIKNNALTEEFVNSIINKIASSNLDVKEKRAALERLIRNQDIEDELRYTKERGNIKNDLTYTSGHIRNLLTAEENRIMDELAQNELDRNEQKTNANFIREMQRKERETATEMEKFKMQFDRDHEIRVMDHELKEKDYEIEHLKLVLASYEKLNAQDIQKLGIEEAHKTARAKAEFDYKTEMERTKREDEQKREQDRIAREEAYSKRADELLSQMMTIQAALQMTVLENEKFSKKEDTDLAKLQTETTGDVAKVQALSSAEVGKAQAWANAEAQKAKASTDLHNSYLNADIQKAIIDADVKKTYANADVEKEYAKSNANVAIANATMQYNDKISSLMDELKKIANKLEHAERKMNQATRKTQQPTSSGTNNNPQRWYEKTMDFNYHQQPGMEEVERCSCGERINPFSSACPRCGKKYK